MNDSFGGGFNTTATKKGDAKSEGVLPVVIKQILDAEEGIKLFDLNYSMLVFVAIVRRIDHSSTKVTYLLEDHTGQIEGHYWLENDGDSQQVPQVMLDSYARIVGSARTTGGTKTLMIYKMVPVKQANQLNTHLLEVLNARYKAEAYSKKVDEGGQTAMEGVSLTQAAPVNSYGLKGNPQIIFQTIQQFVSDTGISRQELERKLPKIQASEFTSILDNLTQEGIIYTTIDMDHYLCVDA